MIKNRININDETKNSKKKNNFNEENQLNQPNINLNTELDDEATLRLAPKSWQTWVKEGEISRDKLIRRVHKITIVSKDDQLPAAGTREEKCLDSVYKFYDGRKHHFELLASKVVAIIIGETNANYKEGCDLRLKTDPV
jgi:hypothetical protein